jgi:hypothetical protein
LGLLFFCKDCGTPYLPNEDFALQFALYPGFAMGGTAACSTECSLLFNLLQLSFRKSIKQNLCLFFIREISLQEVGSFYFLFQGIKELRQRFISLFFLSLIKI